MLSLVFRWILLAVLVCASLGQFSSYSHDYSDHGTSARLTKLEEKMDVLINEVSRLSDSKSDGGEIQSFVPVTLESVERTPGPSGNIFTLSFINNVQELYYFVSAMNNHIDERLVSGVKSSKGPASISFTCAGVCNSKDQVDVLFTNRTKSFEMALQLNNTGTRAEYQDQFTVPELRVKHSGDLVYHTGRDVKVKISAPYGEERGFSDVVFDLDVGKLGTEHFYTTTETHMVKQSEQKRFLENRESLVTISTSEADISGLLHMKLAFSDPEPLLVNQIEVERSLILRPRNQTGPYPADYLTFLESHPSYFYARYDQYVHQNCEIGSNCTLSCTGVGEITNMQVNRRPTPEVEWERVQDASEFIYDYSRTAEWTIHPSPTTDSPYMFQCVAFTATTNSSLLMEVDLFSTEFYIDRNRSGIAVTTDETDPDVRHVTINCTVVGRPVQHTNIQLWFHGSHTRHAPAESVWAGLGETVASSTAEVRQSEGFSGASCYSSGRMRHDVYEMDWP